MGTEGESARREEAGTTVKERHLRLMIDSARDHAIFAMDRDGLVTEWNAGAETIFGYSAGEIIGRSGDVLWTPEDRAAGGAAAERDAAARSGWADDRRWHMRKCGARFYASGTLRRMDDGAGVLIGFIKVCRDITAEKIAEEELAEARALIAGLLEAERARLEELFQRAPSFMAALRGPDHLFELVNERYYQLVGRRDLIGLPVREALPEIAGQGFCELLDEVYRTGEPFIGNAMRVLVEAESGKPAERYVDFVYQVTRDRGGAISGLFVQGVDVTERVRSETGLRRLAAIVDSSEDAIIGTDLHSTIVSWNRGAEKILGYRAEEILGRSIKEIIPPERHHEEDAVIRLITRGDRSEHRETERITRGGDRLDVSVTISPIRDAGGNVVGVSRVARDISARKRAQKALQRSEAMFRQLADSMPTIVWAARPDGHVDYYNRRWYEFTGMEEGPPGRDDWRPFIHPDDLEATERSWLEAVRAGTDFEIETRYLRASDRTFRWHLVRGLPIRGGDGRIDRWFGTGTDIDDQKLLQQRNEELLASERAARGEAERASRMKEEFLATLSHELRTPLHAILGWTQILRMGADPKLLTQGIDVIERNANAQTRIIEDLLDMSRIVSGKVRLDVRRTALAPIVEVALETVRPAAEAKGVRLLSILDPSAGPISGDPSRLQQIFWNLLSNAVKFTPRGGSVTTALKRVDSHVEISVTDTGQGIEPDFLPHVFARFRQADPTTTRTHGGLGLGLAIVKQLAELHGGTVRADSRGSGEGAAFTVSLPLTAVRPQADGAAPAPHAGTPERPALDLSPSFTLRRVNVIVVDDDEDARAVVTRLLEGCDATVRSAGSAEEALVLFREMTPDVLVSDIGMPREDGYSLIRRIRALGPARGGRVPAIALTAYARAEDRMKALRAGFQTHLVKPVEAAELLTVVANLAGKPPADG